MLPAELKASTPTLGKLRRGTLGTDISTWVDAGKWEIRGMTLLTTCQKLFPIFTLYKPHQSPYKAHVVDRTAAPWQEGLGFGHQTSAYNTTISSLMLSNNKLVFEGIKRSDPRLLSAWG